MDELGVSRRTLFRDLKMLKLAGVPYFYDPSAGYRISDRFFLPPINLTVTETLGLMVLSKEAAARRSSPLMSPALSAIHKLINTVPEPMRTTCADMMSRISVDPGAATRGVSEASHYLTLQRCVDEGRSCLGVYKAPDQEQPFETMLDPYALHYSQRAWYLFARTDLHDDVRVLKLMRFHKLEQADRTFDPPEGFSIHDKIGNAWQLKPEGTEYDIELEFMPMVANNVAEVHWHASQQHEMLPDGHCRMTFRVDGLGEIAWWLCGYADQVIVRKPDKLRKKVARMLRDAHKRYEANNGG